jgi:hypothetical protein
MRFSDRAKYWSEWQDLNLRSPRPERGAPTISKRKSPEATHVAERHSNDWFGAVWSSRAGPLRLNAAPVHSDINSGSKSVPSRNWSRWDLVKNTLWDSMVRSRSHFANKHLSLFNNGSPPLGTMKSIVRWAYRRSRPPIPIDRDQSSGRIRGTGLEYRQRIGLTPP